MKKILFILLCIFVSSILYGVVNNYEQNNVEENTCTKDKALQIARDYIITNEKEGFIKTIINFDVPSMERMYIEKLRTQNGKNSTYIKSKECWKVTFNYPLDMFCGAYSVYINCKTGRCYGMAFY